MLRTRDDEHVTPKDVNILRPGDLVSTDVNFGQRCGLLVGLCVTPHPVHGHPSKGYLVMWPDGRLDTYPWWMLCRAD